MRNGILVFIIYLFNKRFQNQNHTYQDFTDILQYYKSYTYYTRLDYLKKTLTARLKDISSNFCVMSRFIVLCSIMSNVNLETFLGLQKSLSEQITI